MKTVRIVQQLGLLCGLAGALAITDALAQTQGSITCLPGFDLTCSPKIEVGTTKSSATKKGLVLKRNNLPFDQSDIEVIPYPLELSGSCGENGIGCPTKSFNVGMGFSAVPGVLARNSFASPPNLVSM